jgi:PAS domain S-box-containing protein
VVGGALSTASVVYLTPPLTAFIQEHIDAQLKLASGLGMSICENHFNYLLELRLENNPEFNSALKIQAVEEIKAVSKQFNSVQLMVIEGQHRILGNSRALLEKAPDFPVLDRENRRIRPYLFWGHPVKTHIRYFPFWDWTVVSYVLDSDYLPTIRLARRVVYLGTFGVLGAVWCTLFVVIRRSISRPLKQLAAAAEDVAEGRFSEVPLNRRDEIGRVIDAFNAMVTQLSRQNEELTALITALRESERRYRDLFEGAVEGIIAANADSLQLTYANPAICRMLGYSEAELTQMRMPDIYPRGQAKTLETEFDTQMEREGQARFSGVSCIRRDGKIIQVDIKSTLITIDGTLHILGYFTDVTQQIKAMEEKGKLEARLHRAEKMEAIGTLAGGVAHDLNNILSGLVSYPELLLMDLPSDSPLR